MPTFNPKNIREARRKCGKSQPKLAVEIDRALSTWIHYERGEREPSAAMIGKIAAAIGVDVSVFYDDDNTEQVAV